MWAIKRSVSVTAGVPSPKLQVQEAIPKSSLEALPSNEQARPEQVKVKSGFGASSQGSFWFRGSEAEPTAISCRASAA